MVCRPTMTTQLQIENKDGETISPTSIGGITSWGQIPPESKIKYQITTYPEWDDSQPLGSANPKSDKVKFEIWRSNEEYIKQVADTVYSRASSEQREIYNQEIVNYLNGDAQDMPSLQQDIFANTDEERTISQVYSKIIHTDSEGVGKGTYNIPSGAKWGTYSFIFNYGYNHDAETITEKERLQEVRFQIIKGRIVGFVIMALIYVSIVYLCLGTALIGGLGLTGVKAGVVFATAFATQWTVEGLMIDYIANNTQIIPSIAEWCAIKSIGDIGNNKYGCDFIGETGNEPSPVIHKYGAVVAPYIEQTSSGEWTTTNLPPKSKTQSNQQQTKEMIDRNQMFIWVGGLIGFSALYSMMFGGRSE